ncbi:hypothetical protein GH741_16305 [Aquibacillus halophilus]|uniref:Uncharacterized protein n=1 Tax=Aquibacillus halophilus TaxID=930132 RepID=A0A6A8DIC1_9BACI|nr:hypothetical protein [Aquibacillus halophilus]MRH44206.1 hypothetical protein [Aquibacillus halophilus]
MKRCPRKATARSANQLVARLRRILYQLRRLKGYKTYENGEIAVRITDK